MFFLNTANISKKNLNWEVKEVLNESVAIRRASAISGEVNAAALQATHKGH